MRVCTGTLTAVALALSACGPSPTQVVVQLVADEAVAAPSARVAVEVVSPGGELTRRVAEVGATPDHRWPFQVVVVPARADSERFLVTAEVFDGEGRSLGVQRVHTRFVRGATRYVRLRFSAACAEVRCAERETCVDGACAAACVEPVPDPDRAPAPGPCLQGRPDLDAGGPPDAGTGDGGVDGGVDGGPPPARCPVGDVATFDFEAPLDVPRCPGALPCETSPTGRVERAEEGSALAAPAPSPCGGAVLRASVFDSASPNAAYVAVSGAPHLRAWIWLPAEGGERVDSPTELLALAPGEATRDVAAPRVPHWLEDGRLRLSADEEVDLGAAPLGRWICLGLSLSGGAAEADVDGARSRAPSGLSLAEGGHARVGLAARAAGENALVWVDQVTTSSAPTPCP